MRQEKLTDRGKIILKALSDKKYKSSVPDDDVRDFLILQEKGFVTAVVASDKDSTTYLAPSITSKGLAYIAEYPSLKNPKKHFDWKFWLTTIVAIGMLVFAALTYLKK